MCNKITRDYSNISSKFYYRNTYNGKNETTND